MNATHRDLVIRSASYSRERDVPRSEGTHLSTIIQRITERERVRTGKGSYDDWAEEELEGVRTPGFVWERVMGEHAREVNPGYDLIYPGEMFWCRNCDEYFNGVGGNGVNPAGEHCRRTGHRGIYFTPDSVLVPTILTPAPFPPIPLEWKFTWMSSKRAYDAALEADGVGPAHLDGVAKWVWQLGWACPCFGSRRAQIQAMFARADYSSGRPSVITKVFDIEFSEKDLRRVKVMIVSNAVAEGLL